LLYFATAISSDSYYYYHYYYYYYYYYYLIHEFGHGFPLIYRTLIKKVFERLEAFIVGNYRVQRHYVHGENDFVLAGEIESTENFNCVVVDFDIFTL